MNANIVSILSWSRPGKTALVLVTVNLILWTLTRQRPFYVLPMIILVWYCRQLWRHRIRGEVLVDPPDHEDWTDWISLSTYDLQRSVSTHLKDLFHHWLELRETNHFMWTAATCTIWIILAKIGMEIDFLTMLFILSNAAFVVFPAMEKMPKFDMIGNDESIHEVEDNMFRGGGSGRISLTSTPLQGQFSFNEPHHPSLSQTPSQMYQSTPSSSFAFEGMLTRSMTKAAAASASLMSTSSTAVFSIGEQVTAAIQQLREERSSITNPFPLEEEEEEGIDTSISPAIQQMPDHEEVANSSDLDEDEFLFDARHFDKSSSSRSSTSISASFEIIDDDLQ